MSIGVVMIVEIARSALLVVALVPMLAVSLLWLISKLMDFMMFEDVKEVEK